MALGGFSAARFVVLIIGAVGAWLAWRRLAPPPSSPMISLVMLLKQPRYLEDRVLAEVLKSAWDLPFETGGESGGPAEGNAKPFVVGESPLFMVNTGDAMFVIHNHERTYFDEPDKVVEGIPNLRLRKIITDHQAWLSVDCMWTKDDVRAAQYPRIARAIAELADDSVLGLFQPEDSRLIPWDEGLEGRLRKATDLSEVFKSDLLPVVSVSDDDPRMIAAVAEARRRWPEFVAAFKVRQPGGVFSVKAPVTREDNREFIWLDVIGLEPEYIHGNLANDPVDLGGLKLGDQVEVPLSDLNDWAYAPREGDEPVGLFTVKVLTDAYKEQVAKCAGKT